MSLSFAKTADFLETVGMTRHAESRLRGVLRLELVNTAGGDIRIGIMNRETGEEMYLLADPQKTEIVSHL